MTHAGVLALTKLFTITHDVAYLKAAAARRQKAGGIISASRVYPKRKEAQGIYSNLIELYT